MVLFHAGFLASPSPPTSSVAFRERRTRTSSWRWSWWESTDSRASSSTSSTHDPELPRPRWSRSRLMWWACALGFKSVFPDFWLCSFSRPAPQKNLEQHTTFWIRYSASKVLSMRNIFHVMKCMPLRVYVLNWLSDDFAGLIDWLILQALASYNSKQNAIWTDML